MKRLGLLLSVLVLVGGLVAVSRILLPEPFAHWTIASDEQPCGGTVSRAAQSCELLLVVHLLPSDQLPTDRLSTDRLPTDAGPGRRDSGLDGERREQALMRVEAVREQARAAIARVPGVARVRAFGDAGEAASTRSLLNREPTLALAVFRTRDAEASAVASAVREVLVRLGEGLSIRLRWAIPYDATRFAERSFPARIESTFEALWHGAGPTPEPHYVVASVHLPEDASPERTDALLRRVSEIAFTHPAVESAMAFAGLADDGSGGVSNVGLVFLTLRPSAGRSNPESSADAIAAALNDRLARVEEIAATVVSPVDVPRDAIGIGQANGTGETPTLAAVFASHRDAESSLLANADPRHSGR